MTGSLRDQAVDAAALAYFEAESDRKWEQAEDWSKDLYRDCIRAALAKAEPFLLAQFREELLSDEALHELADLLEDGEWERPATNRIKSLRAALDHIKETSPTTNENRCGGTGECEIPNGPVYECPGCPDCEETTR